MEPRGSSRGCARRHTISIERDARGLRELTDLHALRLEPSLDCGLERSAVEGALCLEQVRQPHRSCIACVSALCGRNICVRPTARPTHNSATTSAGAKLSRRRRCVAMAPAMSTVRHTAAIGVSTGAMPVATGRISPAAPGTSARPSSLVRDRRHSVAQCIRVCELLAGDEELRCPRGARALRLHAERVWQIVRRGTACLESVAPLARHAACFTSTWKGRSAHDLPSRTRRDDVRGRSWNATRVLSAPECDETKKADSRRLRHRAFGVDDADCIVWLLPEERDESSGHHGG